MIASVAELMHIDGLYNETIHRYECMSNPDEDTKEAYKKLVKAKQDYDTGVVSWNDYTMCLTYLRGSLLREGESVMEFWR
mgnify:FL=1